MHRFWVLCRTRLGARLVVWRRRAWRSRARLPLDRSSPDFGANQTAQTRAALDRLQLSTGKRPCLESWCAKCYENTRCCGFLLTSTMDSGIFSSAAVNGLLRKTAQTERFQSSGAHLSACQAFVHHECSLIGGSRVQGDEEAAGSAGGPLKGPTRRGFF
jgi:hypothetical protein